jgi:uncharacterized protein (DUF2062 family)
MIKRYLKKLLPRAQQLKQNSNLSIIGCYLFNPLLWRINRHSIARGVAIGLFLAFVPLPIQMLLAALLAILFSANLPIAVALTWITNPFTFLPINYFIYKVGQRLLGNSSAYQAIPDFEFSKQSWQDIIQPFFQWVQSAGKPFLTGLPVVAISASILGYVLTHLIWRALIYWHLKKKVSMK